MYIGLDNWKAGFLFKSYLFFYSFWILISSKDYFSIVFTAQEHKFDIDCTTYKEHILHHQKKDTDFWFKNNIMWSFIYFIYDMLMYITLLKYLFTLLVSWFYSKCNPRKILLYFLICFSDPLGGILINTIFKPILVGYET